MSLKDFHEFSAKGAIAISARMAAVAVPLRP